MRWILLLLVLYCSAGLLAQEKYFTRTGKVVFFSKAPIEDIKAVNNQVSCVYDIESNRLVANVLIKAFEFEKSLMQQHFNENYLESDKFPKASFKGKIINNQSLDFKSNWTKTIEYEGDLSIHGITKNFKNTASFSNTEGVLTVNTEFYLTIKDYEIKIPSTLINNIAEKVQVKINLKMNLLKK